MSRSIRVAAVLTRLSLAACLLSAVADRVGLWGPHGAPGVSWGDFPHFLTYVATLNPWCPPALLPALGWIATVLEAVLAVGLIVGWQVRWFALGTALLTALFALSMTLFTGVHSALSYAVFPFSAAAYLLFTLGDTPDKPTR